ncbi:hypothetical protein G6F57_003349 [Rhizopus arrhizus]|nr:hypothetical protein G6F57_003349 [Rhizopus arrhizus]
MPTKFKKTENLDDLKTELAELENCEEMRDEVNLSELQEAITEFENTEKSDDLEKKIADLQIIHKEQVKESNALKAVEIIKDATEAKTQVEPEKDASKIKKLIKKIKKAANLDGLETELAELENCEEMRDEFNLFNLKKAIRRFKEKTKPKIFKKKLMEIQKKCEEINPFENRQDVHHVLEAIKPFADYDAKTKEKEAKEREEKERKAKEKERKAKEKEAKEKEEKERKKKEREAKRKAKRKAKEEVKEEEVKEEEVKEEEVKEEEIKEEIKEEKKNQAKNEEKPKIDKEKLLCGLGDVEPDYLVDVFKMDKDNSKLFFTNFVGEIKTESSFKKEIGLTYVDLYRLATFSKLFMINKDLSSVMSVQVIGASYTFYLLNFQGENLYTMIELGKIALPTTTNDFFRKT